MISKDEWNIILNDYKNNLLNKNNYNIPKCFIYSRLAYEGLIKYNSKEYNSNIERIEID